MVRANAAGHAPGGQPRRIKCIGPSPEAERRSGEQATCPLAQAAAAAAAAADTDRGDHWYLGAERADDRGRVRRLGSQPADAPARADDGPPSTSSGERRAPG